MATAIKQTPLYDIHCSLGAKMTDFAGYMMPISYAGIKAEHQCVREQVGIFDVSHMGEFIIRGKKAFDLIQSLTCNDLNRIKSGKAQYTCLMNEQGGIVDDLIVYRIGEEVFMLVVNAANIQKDWDWIAQHCPKEEVEMINISDRTALLAVQGPKALEVLQDLTPMNLSWMKPFEFHKGVFAGLENVLVSATGYTGAGGFEIYFDNDHAKMIWNAIMEAGAAHGIQAIGLGARDTLRLEKGYCLYGNDISDTTTPLEAGLSWVVRLKTDFVGKKALQAQKIIGIQRKLVGFVIEGKGIARHGYAVVDEEGNAIGEVTSGTQSPILKKAIGLAYVPVHLAAIGQELLIQVRKKRVVAKVTKLPFV